MVNFVMGFFVVLFYFWFCFFFFPSPFNPEEDTETKSWDQEGKELFTIN